MGDSASDESSGFTFVDLAELDGAVVGWLFAVLPLAQLLLASGISHVGPPRLFALWVPGEAAVPFSRPAQDDEHSRQGNDGQLVRVHRLFGQRARHVPTLSVANPLPGLIDHVAKKEANREEEAQQVFLVQHADFGNGLLISFYRCSSGLNLGVDRSIEPYRGVAEDGQCSGEEFGNVDVADILFFATFLSEPLGEPQGNPRRRDDDADDWHYGLIPARPEGSTTQGNGIHPQCNHVEEHTAHEAEGKVREEFSHHERVAVGVGLEVKGEEQVDDASHADKAMDPEAVVHALPRLGGLGVLECHERPQEGDVRK
mmetsp:Transcript_22244/g.64613  ORF Transcript_22244/g.64613 Transcript_22244/m.64613 type:complete len:314 (-) Transcript_22244:422-1363(-)